MTAVPLFEGQNSAITRARRRSRAVDWALDVVILLLATAGTYLAAEWGRPVTAVLIYLTGVIVIGARSGLFRGVAAALIASLIYNFVLSEPRFRFGVTSVDELVPLIAFNLSAVISGGLAGRLKDAASTARSAQARNALLLAIGDDLQRAVSVADVSRIAAEAMPLHGISLVGLGIWRTDAGSTTEEEQQTLIPLVGGEEIVPSTDTLSFDLVGSRGELGRVMFKPPGLTPNRQELVDLRAVANLLAMAIDRCLLLEQLSESMAVHRSEQLKDALLSSVSHDLRTPLTAIEAAATSLRSFRTSLSVEQQNEMLLTITSQCDKLNRYTANLLDMGRIHAGVGPNQLSQVDVVEILGVALASIRMRFPDQQFIKHVETNSAVIDADAAMLERALVNVLENAVVHGGAGKPVTVLLAFSRVDCFIQITDQRYGITEDEKPRIFERFYRGGQSSKREGTGLGLYIARGFIEAFGGTISLESPPEGVSGTRTVIRLPLAETAEHRGPDDHSHRSRRNCDNELP